MRIQRAEASTTAREHVLGRQTTDSNVMPRFSAVSRHAVKHFKSACRPRRVHWRLYRYAANQVDYVVTGTLAAEACSFTAKSLHTLMKH